MGEILGCTSPVMTQAEDDKDNTVLFLCDGRFHMESTMIANQGFKFYQYDPYSKKITIEEYDTKTMMNNRFYTKSIFKFYF
jgi:2-(3-amino-3-carboxypropyl)histidine synthase